MFLKYSLNFGSHHPQKMASLIFPVVFLNLSLTMFLKILAF